MNKDTDYILMAIIAVMIMIGNYFMGYQHGYEAGVKYCTERLESILPK